MTKVAIIGAGPAGLICGNKALERNLNITIFEKNKAVGGGWGEDSFAWDGMRTNISKYNCTFSEMPWPQQTSLFPSQPEMFNHLKEFYQKCNLATYTRLNSTVTKIFQNQTRNWTVQWTQEAQDKTEEFDAIIVCSGFFSNSKIPNIPGSHRFNGKVYHSREFKSANHEDFINKEVVVVGNGFSGPEIASLIAQTAQKVSIIFNKAKWVLPRSIEKQPNKFVPMDLLFYTQSNYRSAKALDPIQANSLRTYWLQQTCRKQNEVSEKLKVESNPEDPQHVCISDTFLSLIADQKIELNPQRINEITSSTIILENNTRIKAETIVYCTGYETTFPFFEDDLLQVLNYNPKNSLVPLPLHDTIFSRLENLMFCGMVRGPTFLGSELQAEYICNVLSKRMPYPTTIEIEEGIRKEIELGEKEKKMQFPHANYVEYCSTLADKIGLDLSLQPNMIENPELKSMLFTGPFTPAHLLLNKNPQKAIPIIIEINKIANP